MRTFVRRFGIALLALALITGCGGAESQIVGQWKVAGDPNGPVWEFSSNKAIDMAGRKGKYTFGGQGRLKVETQFATFVYQLDLTNHRMVLTEPNGTRVELERMK